MKQRDMAWVTAFASYVDEDRILDGWLASLEPSQFEHVLYRLAEPAGLPTAAREESA